MMISELRWMELIRNELKRYMDEQNMTQRELADKAGLSEMSISRYMSCDRLMSLKAAMNISYALGIDINDLVDFGQRIN